MHVYIPLRISSQAKFDSLLGGLKGVPGVGGAIGSHLDSIQEKLGGVLGKRREGRDVIS